MAKPDALVLDFLMKVHQSKKADAAEADERHDADAQRLEEAQAAERASREEAIRCHELEREASRALHAYMSQFPGVPEATDLGQKLFEAGGGEPSVSVVETELPVTEGPLTGVPTLEAMYYVLEQADDALSLEEIAEAMKRLGWKSAAEKPTDTLRMAMRRTPAHRIERPTRGRYALGRSATNQQTGDLDRPGSEGEGGAEDIFAGS